MKIRPVLFAATALLGANLAQAVPFTPTFAEYAFPGSQYTVDAAANAYFSSNYGITIDNAYLYRDGRDTFDGIGVSTGETSEFGTTQTARINFLDTTNFVTIDWWSIMATTYNAYTAANVLIGTFSVGENLTGTHTFNGGSSLISYLTWTSQTGFGQVSGLSYDYDGTTDGRNDDLDPRPTTVPEPGTLMLLGIGLAALGLRRRKEAA